MEKITMRRATPMDKDIVLRINDNVYEGRDYLPAYYDHFLRSPAMFPAVMLYEDQIIAFEVGHLVDNGETVVNRGGRVHPRFEGKGLVKQLSQYCADWGYAKGATNIVFTVGDYSPALRRPSFRSVTKHLLTRLFPMYYLAGQGLTFSDADVTNASRLRTIGSLELTLYFKSKPTQVYFSPQGRMVVDAVPYQIIEENIPFMLQPAEYLNIYSDIKCESGKCSGLLSFGFLYPVPRPQYKYILDIFGNDTLTLRTHLVKHLMRIKKYTTGVTALLIYVSDDFDMDKIDAVLDEFGISRRPHNSRNPKLKSNELYAFAGLDPNKSKL